MTRVYTVKSYSPSLQGMCGTHAWASITHMETTHGRVVVDLLFGIKAWKAQWWTACRWRCDICRGYEYHLGRLVDFTTGDIPSLYRLLVLLKFTMLKITLWNNKRTDISVRWNQGYFIIYENAHSGGKKPTKMRVDMLFETEKQKL